MHGYAPGPVASNGIRDLDQDIPPPLHISYPFNIAQNTAASDTELYPDMFHLDYKSLRFHPVLGSKVVIPQAKSQQFALHHMSNCSSGVSLFKSAGKNVST